jgi:hypothetical protein
MQRQGRQKEDKGCILPHRSYPTGLELAHRDSRQSSSDPLTGRTCVYFPCLYILVCPHHRLLSIRYCTFTPYDLHCTQCVHSRTDTPDVHHHPSLTLVIHDGLCRPIPPHPDHLGQPARRDGPPRPPWSPRAPWFPRARYAFCTSVILISRRVHKHADGGDRYKPISVLISSPPRSTLHSSAHTRAA